ICYYRDAISALNRWSIVWWGPRWGNSPSQVPTTGLVQEGAGCFGGAGRFAADLVQLPGRVARGRAPDVDHGDRVPPGVQHRGRGPGGELLVLARTERVAGLPDLRELPLQPVPVGDRVR